MTAVLPCEVDLARMPLRTAGSTTVDKAQHFVTYLNNRRTEDPAFATVRHLYSEGGLVFWDVTFREIDPTTFQVLKSLGGTVQDKPKGLS